MSDERVNQPVSTTKWTPTKWASALTFAIVGILFVVGLSLPQQSEAGVALPRPLLFQSPIGNPVLTIDKTADNTTPRPGDIVNYTVAYGNTAEGSQAFNVRVYDFLPAGVQYLSASPAPVSTADGILLFTAPSVGPTTALSNITVQVRVLSGYAGLNNQVLVTADGVTPTVDSLLITTVPATDHLRLTKVGDAAALVGGELDYTLRCENTGPVAYSNIELIDVLPAGVTLVSASVPPATVTPPLIKWSVGTLAPGAWWEVNLATTAPATAGSITNTAWLNAPTHTSLQALWATQVVTEGIILDVNKTGSATEIYPGDQLVYTLTYRNKGTIAATNVILTDTLPVGVNASGALPAPTSTSDQQWTWQIPTLNAGATGSIVITTSVAANASGALVNQVEITAPDAWNDSASFTATVKSRAIYLPLVLRAYSP
ncbi:MAG: DUF11 domain-containing protein [Anaerolineae bacterium]